MKLRQVPLDQVDIPEVRVTAVYDEEHLKLLKSSLAAMGTVNPIIVVATGERFQVVDGLHRLEEARERGETRIPAVVYEGDPASALEMNLVLNRVRGKTKASEMVAVIKELTEKHGRSSDDIADRTGLSRDYVEKLQAISRAHLVLTELLDREIIGVGAAYEVARLPRPAQQEELCAKYQVWRFTVKELHEFVDQVLRAMEERPAEGVPAGPSAPAAPPKFYCEGCREEMEPKQLRSVSLCPECYGVVFREAKKRTISTAVVPESTPPG